jgi:membrane protease YdiL (CAAX protease family)
VLDPAPELVPVSPAHAGDEPGPPPAAAVPSRRLLPVERLGALIEVILCSGVPTQILVVGALTSLGMQPRTADGGLSPSFVIALSLIDMVLVIGLVRLFLHAHRERLRHLVVGARPPGREALLGIALIPATFVLAVLVLAAILTLRPELHNVAVNPFERLMETPQDAAIFALVAMFAGGLREEIQRAFIIHRFDGYLGGGLLGIALYSGVFALGHVEQGYAAAIATGTLGAAWGLVFYLRRSAIAPIVSHAGFNVGQLLKFVAFGA